ncbi:MAG: hypothetical protein ACM3NF_10585 [Gemmatimonadota bacterium]
MELTLTKMELELLRELLEGDYSRIILEIAKTDTRKMREELKIREELLKGVMEKLGMSVRGAA